MLYQLTLMQCIPQGIYLKWKKFCARYSQLGNVQVVADNLCTPMPLSSKSVIHRVSEIDLNWLMQQDTIGAGQENGLSFE